MKLTVTQGATTIAWEDENCTDSLEFVLAKITDQVQRMELTKRIPSYPIAPTVQPAWWQTPIISSEALKPNSSTVVLTTDDLLKMNRSYTCSMTPDQLGTFTSNKASDYKPKVD